MAGRTFSFIYQGKGGKACTQASDTTEIPTRTAKARLQADVSKHTNSEAKAEKSFPAGSNNTN